VWAIVERNIFYETVNGVVGIRRQSGRGQCEDLALDEGIWLHKWFGYFLLKKVHYGKEKHR
jgi:hypothetical protein